MSYYYLVVGLIYKLELINQKQYEELNKLAIKGVIPDQPEAILNLIEKVLKEDEESFAKRIRTLEAKTKSIDTEVGVKLEGILNHLKASSVKKSVDKKK
jgi:23S rRNA maturation mini-RNase III